MGMNGSEGSSLSSLQGGNISERLAQSQEKEYNYLFLDNQESEEELIMTVITILFKAGIL